VNPHSNIPAQPDRRVFLNSASGLVAGGLLLASGNTELVFGSLLDPSPRAGEFTLPDLPYAYDALEPVIDKETMNIHHTKHHQAYITKLNEAVAAHPELAGKSLEQLLTHIPSAPESARAALRNHGGGHHNHSLFWKVMRAPQADNAPSGPLAEQIFSTFGSFDSFKEAFSKNAMDQFGSGWSWLVVHDGELELLKTANQDSPLMDGKRPILGIDVWEHAYYLKYQNRRADYVAAWWSLVNWDEVSRLFSA
jgi:Fe-Mn family superoxide dismutase